MNNYFFIAAEMNLKQLDIEQLESEKRKQLSAMNVEEQALKVPTNKSNIMQSLDFDHLPKTDVDILLLWHGIMPGKQAQENKVSRLVSIFQLNTPQPQVARWTAEDDARLQNLKEKEISLNDTAVSRKTIILLSFERSFVNY